MDTQPTSSGPTVSFEDRDGLRIIRAGNPPVNALSRATCAKLIEALEVAAAAQSVHVVALICEGRSFFSGADISEFGDGKGGPRVYDLTAALRAFPKPIVALAHGHALGGGLEVALACDGRIAAPGTVLGTPEVKLGLIPGAGGTQLLPRLIGVEATLPLVCGGETIVAERALALGLIDALQEGDLVEAAIKWVRDRDKKAAHLRPKPADADDRAITKCRDALVRESGWTGAKAAAVEAVETATRLPLDKGLVRERALFEGLAVTVESRAMRHLFFAERGVAKVPHLARTTPRRDIARVAVIGSGTMGAGISLSVAEAGIPVRLIDLSEEAVGKARRSVGSHFARLVDKGRMKPDAAEAAEARIEVTVGGASAAADADLVIEAIVEDMAIKKSLFADLARVCSDTAILATNTSTLDVNAIAQATGCPDRVLGLHFFSPANVMRLLEVVRGAATSDEVLASALHFARRIGKLPVVVGVCDGFVGNRMLAERTREAERLLHEGPLPREVDAVFERFGFPMGPFAVADLAGIDVNWRVRQARGTPLEIADRLYELGRYGQKAGRGYYRYAPGARRGEPDPEVEAMVRAVADREGISAGARPDDREVLERLLFPIVNTGARILEERIAQRPADIDVIWTNGYGWPKSTGGPMFYADSVGCGRILARIEDMFARYQDPKLEPSPLLRKLVAEGRGFSSLNAA